MSKESYEIGKTVYFGIESSENNPLPQKYLDKFTPIAKERVVLAGYRLAYIIIDIFKPNQKLTIL